MDFMFAVFFKRPEPFRPVRFPRQRIVDFINKGSYFAKEPKFKPSAKSLEMEEPQWFTLDVRLDSTASIQVRWSDWNHGFPYSVEPLKSMAEGLVIDSQVSDSGGLAQAVAESTDAISVYAVETDMSDGCRRMLHDLQTFLQTAVPGILFDPSDGLHGRKSDLTFPNNVRHPLGALSFGKKGGRYVIAVSPDGSTIATGGDPGNKAGLWDAETGSPKNVLAGHKKATRSVAFSPDGKTVATGSEDKSVILWDTVTGRSKAILRGHGALVGAAAFSPDGQMLASGDYEGTIFLWSLPDGTERAAVRAHGQAVIGIKDGEKWHSSRSTPASVCSVAFSPDGQHLASGGTDGTVRVCAVQSRELLRTFEGYTESAWPVTFSPDGQMLAAGSVMVQPELENRDV